MTTNSVEEKRVLSVVVSVVARDDMVVRSSVRLDGMVDAGKVVVKESKVPGEMPYELKVLQGLTSVMSDMVSAGICGSVFIADKVMPRFLQARKLVDKHNAVDIMILPWMKGEDEEEYRETFGGLLREMRRAKNQGLLVIVRGVSELWKVSLSEEGGYYPPIRDLVGKTIDIRGGICEEYGIRVLGSQRFSGKIVIRERYDRGQLVVYGDIVDESLPKKALSFLEHGRTAVKSAMEKLPTFVRHERLVEVGGDF